MNDLLQTGTKDSAESTSTWLCWQNPIFPWTIFLWDAQSMGKSAHLPRTLTKSVNHSFSSKRESCEKALSHSPTSKKEHLSKCHFYHIFKNIRIWVNWTLFPTPLEEVFPVRNVLLTSLYDNMKSLYDNNHKFCTPNWIYLLKEIEYMNFRLGKSI